jgi:hypothetical protein
MCKIIILSSQEAFLKQKSSKFGQTKTAMGSKVANFIFK